MRLSILTSSQSSPQKDVTNGLGCKRIFFGADVLCVPQGHVQGVSERFTLNSMCL